MIIPGYRKTILKGIESLRKPSIPKLPAIKAVAAVESAFAGVAISSAVIPSKHWSHIEPLSSKKVTAPTVLANSADYLNSNDALDEAAEHFAFQKAVMEWRNGGKSLIEISSESIISNPVVFASKDTEITQSLSATTASMWHNPFSSHQVISMDDEDSEQVAMPEVQPLPLQQRPLLAEGDLDEAKEHEVNVTRPLVFQ